MPMYRERSKRVEAIEVSAANVGRLRQLGVHMSPDGYGVIKGRIRLAVSPGEWLIKDADGELKVIQSSALERKYEPDAP